MIARRTCANRLTCGHTSSLLGLDDFERDFRLANDLCETCILARMETPTLAPTMSEAMIARTTDAWPRGYAKTNSDLYRCTHDSHYDVQIPKGTLCFLDGEKGHIECATHEKEA